MSEIKKRPAEISSHRERIALRVIYENGPIVAAEHPEIADFYRSGLTMVEIAQRIGLEGHTVDVSRGIVRNALEQLITKEERERITRKFAAEKCRPGGLRVKANRIGICGLTKAQRSEIGKRAGHIGGTVSKEKAVGLFGRSKEKRIQDARNAGKKGGSLTYEKGVGCHGLSKEQRSANSTRNGIKNALKNGYQPWIRHLVDPETGLNELQFLLHLSRKPEFQHRSGSNKGHIQREKVANELNRVFHSGESVRRPHQVSRQLCIIRKTKSGWTD